MAQNVTLHVKLINNEWLMKIQVSLDVKRTNNNKRSMNRGFPLKSKQSRMFNCTKKITFPLNSTGYVKVTRSDWEGV